MSGETYEDVILPFDGVLGVSWLLGNEQEGPAASPIVNALKGAEKRQFTIWFNSTYVNRRILLAHLCRLSTSGVTESKVTVGGNDPDHCQLDNIFDELYIPLSLYGGSQLSIVVQS